MPRALGVDEVIPCPQIRSGEAVDRLLEVAGTDYQTVAASADRLHFARTARPLWSLITGIVLAPVIIGIPFLLIKRTETWIAAIEEDHRRVEIHVTGRVIAPVMESLHAALGMPSTPAQAVSAAPIERVLAPNARPLSDVPDQTLRQVDGVTETSLSDQVLVSTTRSSAADRRGDTTPMPPSGGKPPMVAPPPSRAADDSNATVLVAPRSSIPSDPEPANEAGMTMVRPKEVALNSSLSMSTDARVAGTPVTHAPIASFDTGETIELNDGEVAFVGRDPGRIGEESAFRLLSIADPDLSISKTHLRLIRRGVELEVTDLGSTNGTSVSTSSSAAPRPLMPQDPVSLGTGATVIFGKRQFVITVVAAT